MTAVMTDTLHFEYISLIAELGDDATDDQIVTELVARHDWTERGARAVLSLARTYGTSILRNALALADAMGIEDGSAGL
jgi:hypothetical protein